MLITQDLHEYLARAADGYETDCPPDIDVVWHAALESPEAYEAYCLENFGVVIDYVVDSPGKCYAKAHCRAHIRR